MNLLQNGNMKKEEFIVLLKDSKSIDTTQSEQLEQISNDFPYFQSARNLYLKSLKNLNSFKYNQALKKTAAYTTDRNLLFNYIIEGKDQDNKQIKVAKNQTIPEKLQIGEPLRFNSSDTYSFNEWLHLANLKTIDRTNEKEKKLEGSNFNLIDKFIKNSPKIKPVKESNSKENFSKDSTKENIDLMTETLACVYLEQKKFNKAIAAYNILSLKYPEKSGFFADRIKAIKFLKKHNS